MASIKSAFSAGAGKVKEIAGLQYNDAAGGSLDVTLPVVSTAAISGSALTASGLVTGATLNIGVAAAAADGFVISSSAVSNSNTKLTTAGYVAAQIAGVTAGVSLQDFTVASATGLTAGNVVALGSGTNAPLVLADKDTDAASNAIGVIKSINSLVVTVQLDAEIVVSDLSALSLGQAVFVGDAGAVIPYSGLASGDFATQVGYVSDVAFDKIVIQCKTFGELA